MSYFDQSQYKRHNLIKASTGETIGFAFIKKEETVTSFDILHAVSEEESGLTSSGYISQAEDTGDQLVKLEPEEGVGEDDKDISNIFLGDISEEMSDTKSVNESKAVKCKEEALSKNPSTANLLSSLAAELLMSAKDERGSKPATLKAEENGETSCSRPELEKGLKGLGGRQQYKRNLERPGQFGWLREVVENQSEGFVSKVNYLTPPHPADGNRKRLKRMMDVETFLKVQNIKGLSPDNFNFGRRRLDLDPKYETICATKASKAWKQLPQHQGGSIYAKYFKELPPLSTDGQTDKTRRSIKVECLVGNCGHQTSKANISRHMRQYHLPDEECSTCGVEFPATQIRRHQSECVTKMEEKGGEEQSRVDSENNPRGAEVNKKYSTGSKSELACEEQETVNASSTSKGETKPDFDHHTSISIKYGLNKYNVRMEPERKMDRVMRKLAEMIGKPVHQLKFKVEKSDRTITGEETMREFKGEVFVVDLIEGENDPSFR